MKKTITVITKIIIILLFILTLIFAYLSFFEKDLLLGYLDIFKNFIHTLGNRNYLIIFLFGFIESFPLLGIAVPGQMVLIVIAGFLGLKYMYFTMICASLGAVLGNYVGYRMGIHYGDSFFDKYGAWIGITKTDVKYIKTGIDKHGWLFVILGKFHNMFRAFVPFIAGSSKMHSTKFTLANILGSVLRGVVMVLLGVFFIENAEVILQNVGKIILGIIIIFGVYIYFFQKEAFIIYMREKNKEMEEMINK